MLTVLHDIPPGLLEAQPLRLDQILNGPTLVHLPGKRERPLFVSVLLHGNETSGFLALQALLREFQGRELPRALSFFIGNVEAAKRGVRQLEVDYNRIWCDGRGPEFDMAEEILSEMGRRHVWAAVDIHNNTSRNPHYGCVTTLDSRGLRLARLFSEDVVYFLKPNTVLSAAFSELCPSVTLECGRVGDPAGARRTLAYLRKVMEMEEIPATPLAEGAVNLYHTMAAMKIPESVDFGFGETDAPLAFPLELDLMNFTELAAGTVLGRVRNGAGNGLEVTDERDRQVFDAYFRLEGEELVTRRPFIPSMMTLNARVIREDCFGYIMERIRSPQPLEGTLGVDLRQRGA